MDKLFFRDGFCGIYSEIARRETKEPYHVSRIWRAREPRKACGFYDVSEQSNARKVEKF